MRKIRRQKGLSLVEVTIMLLVLMLLTSVLAPSIWDFVHDAQWVKVKEDCEAIGISFSRLVRDIGPCLRTVAVMPCQIDTRVDVLRSEGAEVPDLGGVFVSPNMQTHGWNVGTGGAFNFDTMHNQFVINNPDYATPFEKFYPLGVYPVGPQYNLGWRGAYLAPPIGPDPWGSAYKVNSGFMSTALFATGPLEGSQLWWWERDVVCISPGPNQQIETHFATSVLFYGTERGADDYVFVISGSGR